MNVPKLKAPSCRSCQERLARVEQDLLVPLAMSLPPHDPRAAGVPQRMLRSMDPTRGRNERDTKSRAARRAQVQQSAFVPGSSVGALPGFGPLGRTPLALHISAEAIDVFGKKLTRVAFHALYGAYIELDQTITVHVVERGGDEVAIAELIRRGDRADVEPGMLVAARRAADEPRAGLLVVDLWGALRIFCSVVPTSNTEATTAPRQFG